MRQALWRAAGPILFVGNALVVLSIWLGGESARELLSGGPGSILIPLGGLLGLVSFYLILWQLLLMSRVPLLERPWGHDTLSRVHHWTGITAVLLLAAHPLLIVLGYRVGTSATLIGQLTELLRLSDDLVLALIAYLAIVSIVVVSLEIIRRRLRYEWWYTVHLLLYGGIFLAFEHQLELGHDLARSWTAIYWQVLYYGTLAVVVYYRLLRPLIISGWQRYVVERVEAEAGSATSIIIRGRHLDRLRARAGQFIIVRFLARGFWWESHPFSLSEMPTGQRLRITAKMMGDYTERLPRLPVGTHVIIEGPLGRFTLARATRPKILLIAGGIGITPLRAMFQECVRSHRDAVLLYSAATEADFALRDELDELAGHQQKVVYIPTDRKGRLTGEMLRAMVSDVGDRSVYLCGPPGMMRDVRKLVLSLGLPSSQVFTERFMLG